MGGRSGASVSAERTCAECALVDRRTFLAQTALAGVAAFLAGCSAGSGPTGPSFNGPLVVSPAQYPSKNSSIARRPSAVRKSPRTAGRSSQCKVSTCEFASNRLCKAAIRLFRISIKKCILDLNAGAEGSNSDGPFSMA